MHSHSSCLIFRNLSFTWVIILTGQIQNVSVFLQNTRIAAPHLQQAMEGFQSILEKMWTFQSRQYFFIFQVSNLGKTACAVSFPLWESAPGDSKISKYRVELCLRAAGLGSLQLFWCQRHSPGCWNSNTHLGCLNSAVTKVKTWLSQQN